MVQEEEEEEEFIQNSRSFFLYHAMILARMGEPKR
jgi:hypothetical protein